jgi:ectoine hydroxylase-related dioxygenase (phytanoyl-CoA dioxygenase family)
VVLVSLIILLLSLYFVQSKSDVCVHITCVLIFFFQGKAGGFGKTSSKASSNKVEGKAYAKILQKEGVLRLDNVLSSTTADALREYLYNLRQQSEKDVAEGKVQPIERYAHVLLKHNRCDLTIPLGTDPIVTTALNESLRKSPVGGIISSIFGDGAILHEFSCLMSDVGSQRQVIHPDTPFIDGKGPVLYTCFIALQDVTLDMGPTTWLPRTHTMEAHLAFKDVYYKDELVKTQPAVLGLLPKGSCGIFDSRLLHCGTANRSNEGKSRALFYFSFKNPEVGYTGNPASIRLELGAENVPLGALMDDLELFERGEGTPLIDELGRKMR